MQHYLALFYSQWLLKWQYSACHVSGSSAESGSTSNSSWERFELALRCARIEQELQLLKSIGLFTAVTVVNLYTGHTSIIQLV